MYESLFPAADRNGWQIAEPGYYQIQVALHLANEDLVSNPVSLRVAPPRGYDEEFLAQDFFSDDVGRILTFDGTRYLNKGNDTLREVADRLSDRKVAIHARVPLGKAMACEYKLLDVDQAKKVDSAGEAGAKIKKAPAQIQEAKKDLNAALVTDANAAAETLGHIDYRYYAEQFSDTLAAQGNQGDAAAVQNTLLQTLSARKVLDSVLQEIKAKGGSVARGKTAK